MSNFHSPVSANQDAPGRYMPAAQMAMQIMNENGVENLSGLSDREDLFVQWLFDCNMQMGILAGSDSILEHRSVVEGCRAELPRNYFSMYGVSVEGSNVLPVWVDFDRRLAGRTFGNYGNIQDSQFILNSAGPFHVSTSSNMEGLVLVFRYRGPLVDAIGLPYCDYKFKNAYEAFCEWRISKKQRAALETQKSLYRNFLKMKGQSMGQAVYSDISKDQWDNLVAKMKNPYYFGNNRDMAVNSQVNWGPQVARWASNWGWGWGWNAWGA